MSTKMPMPERIKLSGFNNLTKVLSFNLYDFCITLSEEQKEEYIQYIDETYSAKRIEEISFKICEIIEANVISVSGQDYDPVGASTMTLMSDIKGGKWDGKRPSSVSMHLDKSHITAHTYPDAADEQGICSFRVDIDIATCGEIIPLQAINYLFEAFECDVVLIDYVVRGYTRLENGRKIYNDHYFNSIQDFIDPKILEKYKYRSDINIDPANIWQTKLMISESYEATRYLMNPEDTNHPDVEKKMSLLHSEMKEIYQLK